MSVFIYKSAGLFVHRLSYEQPNIFAIGWSSTRFYSILSPRRPPPHHYLGHSLNIELFLIKSLVPPRELFVEFDCLSLTSTSPFFLLLFFSFYLCTFLSIFFSASFTYIGYKIIDKNLSSNSTIYPLVSDARVLSRYTQGLRYNFSWKRNERDFVATGDRHTSSFFSFFFRLPEWNERLQLLKIKWFLGEFVRECDLRARGAIDTDLFGAPRQWGS